MRYEERLQFHCSSKEDIYIDKLIRRHRLSKNYKPEILKNSLLDKFQTNRNIAYSRNKSFDFTKFEKSAKNIIVKFTVPRRRKKYVKGAISKKSNGIVLEKNTPEISKKAKRIKEKFYFIDYCYIYNLILF